MTTSRILRCDVCGVQSQLNAFISIEEVIKSWGWAIVPRDNQHICRSCIQDLVKQKAK